MKDSVEHRWLCSESSIWMNTQSSNDANHKHELEEFIRLEQETQLSAWERVEERLLNEGKGYEMNRLLK